MALFYPESMARMIKNWHLEEKVKGGWTKRLPTYVLGSKSLKIYFWWLFSQAYTTQYGLYKQLGIKSWNNWMYSEICKSYHQTTTTSTILWSLASLLTITNSIPKMAKKKWSTIILKYTSQNEKIYISHEEDVLDI